jgi:hypothetical protein
LLALLDGPSLAPDFPTAPKAQLARFSYPLSVERLFAVDDGLTVGGVEIAAHLGSSSTGERRF